ncbi:uncharacterized protein SAPINGB_P003499 [Magnusiomyces paraingens]|uniref:Histone chaperone RTT106 n=1 Tax=Magnusiomyces paraingens TaxID=2606893 RepID=A0A5E8BQJ3_9ASCO|nr:uncharacterized protein SAPINGB_P003499 [Saprochaete ingens]VVT53291.1 unnamed protein product [Saprochaete ingens]
MTTDQAFAALPDDLRAQVSKAIEQYPGTRNVFLALYSHLTDLNDSSTSKKRKLTPTPSSSNTTAAATTSSASPLNVDEDKCLRIPGVSVQIPLRKRLDVILAPGGLVILQKPGAHISDPPEFVLGATQIRAVYLLPIPEKTRPHWALLITQKAASSEPLLATITADATRTVIKPTGAAAGELYSGDINDMVLLYFQRQNIEPTSVQTLPPGQTFVHVSAHRGSKDGVLYFLPGAVIFGFKKPVLVFELGGIRAISYSSITSSTFNLIVKYKGDVDDEAVTETEFSMIDQRSFEDINRFVDYHGLSNESLAEERRAKVDAKAVFPDELIRASREESKKDQQEQRQPTGKSADSVNFANHEFDSEDDDDDADFGAGGDQNDEEDESGSGSEDERSEDEEASEDIGDSD